MMSAIDAANGNNSTNATDSAAAAAAGGVSIDPRVFHRRARSMINCIWGTEGQADEEFSKAAAILILCGQADNAAYLKSVSLQQWLLGYEFPDSLMIILPKKIIFWISQKRSVYLEVLENPRAVPDKVPIEIVKRTKDDTFNKSLLSKLISNNLANLSGPFGILQKEKPTGKFVTEWNSFTQENLTGVEYVDVASGLASVLARKDEDDLKSIEMACKLTTQVMRNYFVEEFQAIVDAGTKVTHEKLSNMTTACLVDEKKIPKLKFPREANLELAEWCYPPIIQSGGKYDLKPSAISDTTTLHDGTVLCSLGVRYNNYCSNLSRTFLVNPEKGKETNYNFLIQVESYAISLLKEGAVCKDVYDQTVAFIESKRPELVQYFVKSIGFGIGIEFKESAYTLGPKSQKPLAAGQTLTLSVGFQNIPNAEAKPNGDPRNRVYSLLIADTLRIPPAGSEGGQVTILTNFDRQYKDISYEMEDEDVPAENIGKAGKAGAGGGDKLGGPIKKEKDLPASGAAVLKTKLRTEEMEDEMTPEQRRAQHQKQLAEDLQKNGIQRFGSGADSSKNQEKAVFRKFECYRKESTLPKGIDDLKIYVDRRNEAIILPIFGQPVPFHISTLKTLVKNDEGDLSYLRFNFVTPGQAVAKKDQATQQPFEDEKATFVRSLTFRSNDMGRYAELLREVNDLKREVQKREAERKEKAELVEQDKLVEIRGRRPVMLRECFVRPALEGKRLAGDLEIHTNGLRYQSALRSDQRVDILFSNIKHLFFQPCDREVIVVVHIHLKNEIMIGRKKTRDVQFYREVSDVSFDETGNRRRRYNHGDEDEMMAEQEERHRRIQLNKEFKQFAERIGDAAKDVEVEVPIRELAFKGVPFRQPVDLLPTTECLIHLIEPPFLVVTISEIELVYLERVRFGLKSFDMVIIFKDFTRPVQHINSIPTDHLEHVKEWLDSVDVCFTEGPVSLSWPQIMKTVNDDPAAFFEDGGWSNLMPDSDESDDEEEEESEYEQSESAESESSDDDSGEASGSDYGESGSGEDEDEEEESGDDWDDLERKAAKSDRKKDAREDGGGGATNGKKKQKRRDDDPEDEFDDSDDDDDRKKKVVKKPKK